jgi:ATPase family AAA domain-containing protein 1
MPSFFETLKRLADDEVVQRTVALGAIILGCQGVSWLVSTGAAKVKESPTARRHAIAAGCGMALGVLVAAVKIRREEAVAASSRPRALLQASLTAYEDKVKAGLIYPEDLGDDAGFKTLGGLKSQIEAIKELVVLPLSRPELFAHSKVASTPSGLLLYDPPGTGKTMLAKAIAKESGASFLALNTATIKDKYMGESEKLIDGLFSLARKVAPTVVFVDEVDGYLDIRQENEWAYHTAEKTKFLECWDGLNKLDHPVGVCGKRPWVLVVAATNKPWAVDPAALRRMPRQIEVPLPDATARESILRVLLQGERVSPELDYAGVASVAQGYSGSDLKEVVRTASMIPIREALKAEKERTSGPAAAGAGAESGTGNEEAHVRPINDADLLTALETIKPNGDAARQYQQQATAKGRDWSQRGQVAHTPEEVARARAFVLRVRGAAASSTTTVPPATSAASTLPSSSAPLGAASDFLKAVEDLNTLIADFRIRGGGMQHSDAHRVRVTAEDLLSRMLDLAPQVGQVDLSPYVTLVEQAFPSR